MNASARDDVLGRSPARSARSTRQQLAQLQRGDEVDPRRRWTTILQPMIDKLEADRLQGFVPADARVRSRRRRGERNAYDKWIYHRNLWTMQGRTRNAENRLKEKDKESWNKYQELKARARAVRSPEAEEPGPSVHHLRARPRLAADQHPRQRHLRSACSMRCSRASRRPSRSDKPNIVPTATSSGRRTALANWIVSAENPLTARVFVNRVWAQYFGHGISDTVSDFGKQGEKPINPELLDYLAWTFVHDDHWSIKSLQRRILLSSVYRQSSAEHEKGVAVDPNNRLLYAFPRQRLDAEQIRDSLLAASGLLNEKMGGPAVMPRCAVELPARQ